jgi:hypothetical protein
MPTPIAIITQIADIIMGLEVNHGDVTLIQSLGLIQKRYDVNVLIVQFR